MLQMKGILAGQCLTRTCNSACHCRLLIHWNNSFHYQTRKRNKHSLPQFLLQELLHLSFPLSPQPLPRSRLTAGRGNKRTEELLSWAQSAVLILPPVEAFVGAGIQHFPEAPAAFHITAGTAWNNEGALESQAGSVRQIPPRWTICWTPSQVCPANLTWNETHKHGRFYFILFLIYMNCRLPVKLPLSKSHSCMRREGTSLSFILSFVFISLMELLIHWNSRNRN